MPAGRINILVRATDPALERMFIPVRLPVDRGLLVGAHDHRPLHERVRSAVELVRSRRGEGVPPGLPRLDQPVHILDPPFAGRAWSDDRVLIEYAGGRALGQTEQPARHGRAVGADLGHPRYGQGRGDEAVCDVFGSVGHQHRDTGIADELVAGLRPE